MAESMTKPQGWQSPRLFGQRSLHIKPAALFWMRSLEAGHRRRRGTSQRLNARTAIAIGNRQRNRRAIVGKRLIRMAKLGVQIADH